MCGGGGCAGCESCSDPLGSAAPFNLGGLGRLPALGLVIPTGPWPAPRPPMLPPPMTPLPRRPDAPTHTSLRAWAGPPPDCDGVDTGGAWYCAFQWTPTPRLLPRAPEPATLLPPAPLCEGAAVGAADRASNSKGAEQLAEVDFSRGKPAWPAGATAGGPQNCCRYVSPYCVSLMLPMLGSVRSANAEAAAAAEVPPASFISFVSPCPGDCGLCENETRPRRASAAACCDPQPFFPDPCCFRAGMPARWTRG